MTEKLLIPAIKNSLIKEWGGTINVMMPGSKHSIFYVPTSARPLKI